MVTAKAKKETASSACYQGCLHTDRVG